MKKDQVTLHVHPEIYDLIKAGKINMSFAAQGSETDQALQSIKDEGISGQLVKIVNAENAKQSVERQIRTIDTVSYNYRGKGYPADHRIDRPTTRVVFDMVIKEEKDEPKAEPAKA